MCLERVASRGLFGVDDEPHADAGETLGLAETYPADTSTPHVTSVGPWRVVLVVELFSDLRRETVHEEIVTALDAEFGETLAGYSSARGLPAATAYTYRESVDDAWLVTPVAPHWLGMTVGDVLWQQRVREANAVDHFRLSPVGTAERAGTPA